MIFQRRESHVAEMLLSQKIPINIILQTEESIITGGWSSLKPATPAHVSCNSLKEYITLTSMARSERITLLLDENDIKRILDSPTRIEVASDGGFDPLTGISSYGWVVALNRVLITKGRGPTEAHPDLAKSFRSEGYGLASVAAFIMAMVTFFHIPVKEHTWKFYIDNKAMIQCMERYREGI
jgi:hypothetical protein